MFLHGLTLSNNRISIMNINHEKKAKKKLQDFESQDYKTWRSYELEVILKSDDFKDGQRQKRKMHTIYKSISSLIKVYDSYKVTGSYINN